MVAAAKKIQDTLGAESHDSALRDLLELARELPHLAARIEVQRAVLDRLQEEVSVEALRAAHARAEEELRALLGDERATSVEARSLAVAGGEVDQRELVQRARNSYIRPQVSGVQTSPIVAGPLVPLWLDAEDASRLFFVRRVGNGRAGLLQGFVGDWSRLRAVLLEQVRELFPGASLVRRGARGAGGDQLLATIPAGLVVPPARAGRVAGLSPARVTLVLSWSAALLALAAVGVTLRATISVGEQRSRFASAVTHELRTPLTTFRMYSEMLAEDMVPEEQRAEYLATLRRESDRLSHLLENVMSYARLEEGRGGLRLVPVSLQAILDRTLPILERHVRDAGASLEVDAPAAAQLVVDADLEAVGQILFNLVDNACKYGGGAAGTAIRLAVTGGTERVELRVRDDGQGIGHDMAHSIFRPFERGERSGDDVADAKPGIGLGLALARGLARDLGGDLSLEPADGRGACFCLSLRPSAA